MDRLKDFGDEIRQGYSAEGECIILGGAMLDGESVSDCVIRVPIAMLNMTVMGMRQATKNPGLYWTFGGGFSPGDVSVTIDAKNGEFVRRQETE